MNEDMFILVVNDDAEFSYDRVEESEDYDRGNFAKMGFRSDDLRVESVPARETALKGYHADVVILEEDVDDEFYDRYVKTRVQSKDGFVVDRT